VGERQALAPGPFKIHGHFCLRMIEQQTSLKIAMFFSFRFGTACPCVWTSDG
jgi:hypothetical protein